MQENNPHTPDELQKRNLELIKETERLRLIYALSYKECFGSFFNNRLAWSKSYQTVKDPLKIKYGLGLNVHLN